MAITGMLEKEIDIPEDVTVKINGSNIVVNGPNGQLSRELFHPKVKIQKTDSKIIVRSELPRIREKSIVGTFVAHIRNMIFGAENDFEYHMKIVYSHFPMKVNTRGDRFVIENFMGERAPRYADIYDGVKG